MEAHDVLGPALRARGLDGLDVVVLPAAFPAALRHAYRLTVPRAEYQGLINERVAPPAYGLRRGVKAFGPAEVRRARASIRTVPRIRFDLTVPRQPELVEAAELVWAEWRQLGLPVRLVVVPANRQARFRRLVGDVAFDRQLGVLADQIVPLAWVAEARLVSPRVRGWRMDARGIVDYSRVTLTN